MDKWIIILLCSLILICSVGVVCAGENNTIANYTVNTTVPVSDDVVYAEEDGHLNTSLSDGSKGYCLEYGEHEASTGDMFYKVDTSYAVNNINNERVGDYLKTYFLRYYDFAMRDNIVTQHMIWHFTDNFDGWRVNYTIVKDIKDNPLMVDDTGVYDFNSTHYLLYQFSVLLSPYVHHQNYFNYLFEFVGKDVYDNIITGNSSVGDVTSDIVYNESYTVNLQSDIDTTLTNTQSNNDVSPNQSLYQLNQHPTGIPFNILTGIIILLLLIILVKYKK